MPISRERDGIDIRNIFQSNTSNAVQSEEKAEKTENPPTKPDYNPHHTSDHGHASSERCHRQPKHIPASPGSSSQAGCKPNPAKPKATGSTIEQEPSSVSVRAAGGISQSEDYSVTSYGTDRSDRQPSERWGRQKCLGCIERLTQNPFRFTKVGGFIQAC